MRSRDRDHPSQHGESPFLLKIQKISWAWWHMPVIPATRETEAGELPEPKECEVAVSHDHFTIFQPRQQNETLFQKKKSIYLHRDF